MDDWTRIYESDQAWQAGLIEGLLREEDIPCVMLNKQDSLYHIGMLEIYVRPEDVIRAMNIIRERAS
ncbi:MAG TPA: DUF2007 domain-containing protein [Bacteroidales bacterium]|nr:DUF2007 domain-containing protein [Bacteroidales bacterium]HRZ77800.1 DUF2007 domain-containing protein [Bacteroidales bacterium]